MKTLTRRAALLSAVGLGGLTMLASDSPLVDLFAPAPDGPAQPILYRQGVIKSFDQTTLANTVTVGGTDLVNLPLLGVAEAASLAQGSVVGIQLIGNSWAIVGRFVVPGTADATDAITRVAQGIVTATVATSESITNQTSYTDLTTVGPAVTVNVRASGKVLLVLGALTSIAEDVGPGGCMSAELSGANVAAATDSRRTALQLVGPIGSGNIVSASLVSAIPVTGLSPGPTLFTAKYRTIGAFTATFRDRNITVFAL